MDKNTHHVLNLSNAPSIHLFGEHDMLNLTLIEDCLDPVGLYSIEVGFSLAPFDSAHQ